MIKSFYAGLQPVRNVSMEGASVPKYDRLCWATRICPINGGATPLLFVVFLIQNGVRALSRLETSRKWSVSAMPDFTFEIESGALIRSVAGLDEVGRGPLAGPVVAACVVFRAEPNRTLSAMIDDSKKLTPARRQRAYDALIREEVCHFGVGAASVTEIERLNIGKASHLAMRRALARLPFLPDVALVDGKAKVVLPCDVRMLIKGDQKSLSIAAASIIAKVTRDKLMTKLARRYAAYGWERNAGYGTAAHLTALRAMGVCRHHRRAFAPIRALTLSKQAACA